MFELYENQGNRIFHGDAVSIISNHIPSESIDLIFVDPPYNIGKKFANFHDKWDSEEEYVNWSYKWLDECIRTLKPKRIILASSHEGSLILDPFAGTFTTAAVAKRLGRQSISIESQAEYLKIGLRRVLGMQEYQGEKLLSPDKSYNIKNKNGKKLDLDLDVKLADI
jgi:DNA modification methylase